MSVLVKCEGAECLTAAIEKYGASDVWWCAADNVTNRVAGARAGLLRYRIVPDANPSDFEIVCDGDEDMKKAVESLSKSKSAPKKASAKKAKPKPKAAEPEGDDGDGKTD